MFANSLEFSIPQWKAHFIILFEVKIITNDMVPKEITSGKRGKKNTKCEFYIATYFSFLCIGFMDDYISAK